MKLFREYINAIKNWRRWDGRSRRRDYWMFTLVNFIITSLLSALIPLLSGNKTLFLTAIFLFGIYSLLIIVPSVAVTIRRLHDTNRSGYYFFVQFIPLIGTIWFLILMATVGDYGPNKYGADPKAEFFQTGIDK